MRLRHMTRAGVLVSVLLLSGFGRAATTERPVISVLYFENRTGQADFDVLRKGLADMMVTDLAAWDGVTVVERERLEAVLRELKLQHTRAFDPAKRQRIGKLLGAQYLIVGAMNLTRPQLHLDAQLIEVQSGIVKVAARASGAVDRVFEIEQDLVGRLTAGIDAKLRNPGQRRTVKVPDLNSLLAYSKAIALWDDGKLDDAAQAMAAVVSRAPAFLMARERKTRILQQLEAHGRRRTEIVSSAVVTLGRLVDEGLKGERSFDRQADEAQRRFLGLRVLRTQVLGRLLRVHLSSRDRALAIVRPGEQAKALRVMRLWAENSRRLVDEVGRYARQRQNQWPQAVLDPQVERLARDAQFARVSLTDDHEAQLVRFVLQGRVPDGEHGYTAAPALGDLDPKEQKAAFDLIERGVAAAIAQHGKAPVAQQPRFEHQAAQLLEEKAAALLRLDQDEAAVGAYQRILDAFPTGARSQYLERRIKQIVGAEHDHERSTRERWAQALKTCADMDIRVGDATLHRKLCRQGLQALAAHAGELERACKPNAKNRSAFAYVYGTLARTAATHEDCAAYRAWYRKYVEADGSVGDMLSFAKRMPWCELGDVTKSVAWLRAPLDDHWTFEVNRNLVSVRSIDGKVLTLSGSREGTNERLALYLDATGPRSYRCRKADWQRLGGERLEGTCTVDITKLATQPGEFDEGTFTAKFGARSPAGMAHTIRLGPGDFRLRRR